MDFLERLGEGYLERKANAAPQQLENLAKKHLFGGGGSESKAKAAPPSAPKAPPAPPAQNKEKDSEIARLRKELAQTKAGKSKASAEAKLLRQGKLPKGEVEAVAAAAAGAEASKKKSTHASHNKHSSAAGNDYESNARESEGNRSSRRRSSAGVGYDRAGRLAMVSAPKPKGNENRERRESDARSPVSHTATASSIARSEVGSIRSLRNGPRRAEPQSPSSAGGSDRKGDFRQEITRETQMVVRSRRPEEEYYRDYDVKEVVPDPGAEFCLVEVIEQAPSSSSSRRRSRRHEYY